MIGISYFILDLRHTIWHPGEEAAGTVEARLDTPTSRDRERWYRVGGAFLQALVWNQLVTGVAMYVCTNIQYGPASTDPHATLGHRLSALALYSQVATNCIQVCLQQVEAVGVRLSLISFYLSAQLMTTALGLSATHDVQDLVWAIIAFCCFWVAILRYPAVYYIFGFFTAVYVVRVLRLKFDTNVSSGCPLSTYDDNASWTLGQTFAVAMLLVILLPVMETYYGTWQRKPQAPY